MNVSQPALCLVKLVCNDVLTREVAVQLQHEFNKTQTKRTGTRFQFTQSLILVTSLTHNKTFQLCVASMTAMRLPNIGIFMLATQN